MLGRGAKSLRNPDAPPATVTAHWLDRTAGRRVRPGSRALAAGLACALLVPLLAAWAIPPAMDWGRFRTGIAAIAAAQLGRPVVISGDVSLRLLPEAVLTATGVVLPDQGDGVSAVLSTLRLQVAVLPLLAGRIVPRDLVLGAPVLRLPWPLPDGLPRPARGRVPHAFAAHIENGALRVGDVEVTGINAGIHDGPEPSAAPGLLPEANAAGFGAEGFAAFAGRNWRFTGALGIPDADGVAALDLAISGQGAAARTNGTVQGTVAEGVVQGRLRAGGPDLSTIIPAPQLAWQADAPFTASGTAIEARSISIALGQSSVDASLNLHVAAPARLDGRVHAASLDLDSWARALQAGAVPGRGTALLAARIDVAADTAQLFGGTVSGLHARLVSDGGGLSIEHAGGSLPGRAAFDLSASITDSAGLPRLTGPARLLAPDLHTTLAWLHHLSPDLISAVPPGVLRSAALNGIISAGPGSLSVSKLAGELDGSGVTGGFGIGLGVRPGFGAGLVLERIPLDDWFGAGWPVPGAAARSGRLWSQFDGNIHLAAATGSLRGVSLRDIALDLRTGASGLKVDRAAAVLSGARLTASGGIGVDGALTEGNFKAAASEAATVLAVVPPAWRWVAGLLRGPAATEATWAGPPGAVAAQFRTDIGDLVAEAELRADIDNHTASGSITLRHPGAPRLLASLGVSGAERWLGTGSVALRGQIKVQPKHLSLHDFDLAAADLRLGGSLDLDLAGAEPALGGTIRSDVLALPGWGDATAFGWDWLRGWSAQLTLSADRVTIAGSSAAQSAAAGLAIGAGIGLLDVTQASVAEGRVTGAVAVDAARGAPVAAMHAQAVGLHVTGPLSGWPVDLVAGEVDGTVDADLAGEGAALDRLDGSATLALHDARLSGLDLAAAQLASASPLKSRQALQAALSQGTSDGLTGTAHIAVGSGKMRLGQTTLASSDGTILVQGSADQAGIAIRLDIASTRASVSQSGSWSSIKATADLGPAAIPRPKRRRR